MKRLLAIGAVSVIGALSIASAAALTVNGGAVQAGQDDSLVCDADGVDVAYTLGAYAPATPPDSGFPVTGVTVSDIDGNCVGRTLDVVLTGTGGVALGSGQLLAITTDTHAIATSGTVDAYDVEDVHVAIH